MTAPIIVVGAGICGVSAAIWLQRSGHQVLLMDKDGPGTGASYGNSGLLAPWAIDPVNSPTLWKDAPKYLFDPNGPLFMKWAYFPNMLPWVVRFMSHATDTRTRRIVKSMMPIVGDSIAQHKSLVQGTQLEKWVHNSKTSFVYYSERAFKADAYSWKMKALAGLEPNIITGSAVRETEPILGPSQQCLAVLEGQGHITNPGQYVIELANHFVDEGGQYIQAKVINLQQSQGRVSRVESDQGSFSCSHAVITAGIWSKDLMRNLGLKVPLESERGYHVIFEQPTELPRNPMVIAAGKFGVNPMDMGLRCAGTVELGNHHSGPSGGPIAFIKRQAAKTFPNLRFSGTQEWMGFRPTTPDSTPLIGELGASGIFLGFGHHHVGLTGGPKTGRLIAQLVDGVRPEIDMAPYAPARYIA